MDYETYLTYAEAEKALADLVGWPSAKIESFYLPDSPNTDEDGNTYVLRCANDYYMRTDGFVRA